MKAMKRSQFHQVGLKLNCALILQVKLFHNFNKEWFTTLASKKWNEKWKIIIIIIFNLPNFQKLFKRYSIDIFNYEVFYCVCARACEDLKWSIFTYDVVQCNKKILQLRTISVLHDLYLDHPSMVVKVVKSNHSTCNKTIMLNWLLQSQLCSNLIKRLSQIY